MSLWALFCDIDDFGQAFPPHGSRLQRPHEYPMAANMGGNRDTLGEQCMTNEEAQDAFAAIVREKLDEKFRDEFVFDPILVQTALDLDGDPCLHAYIVFAGGQRKLDPI